MFPHFILIRNNMTSEEELSLYEKEIGPYYDELCKRWSEGTGEHESSMPLLPSEVVGSMYTELVNCRKKLAAISYAAKNYAFLKVTCSRCREPSELLELIAKNIDVDTEDHYEKILSELNLKNHDLRQILSDIYYCYLYADEKYNNELTQKLKNLAFKGLNQK